MKLFSTGLLAAAGLVSATQINDPCPASADALESTPFKFRWKENYARKKIGTFKIKRRQFEAQLTKNGQVPDYTQTGWTAILQFDRAIPHGTFHLNVGNGLATNKEGSILAFHSHEWNKDLLEVKKHWFEFIFDFNQDLGFDFTVIDIKILPGEYASVQCIYDAAESGVSALGVESADGNSVVSHLDAGITITNVYDGLVPKSCASGLTLNGAAECPCTNGTGDILLSCGANDCVACDDGFNLENGVCNAGVVLNDCACDNGTGDSLETCTGKDCTACNDNFTLTEGLCVSAADTAAASEVETRLLALGAATCAADALDCLSITIMWDNLNGGRNDLDLWVTTPSGSKLYWREKNVDNGVLDIDNTETADNPIENIIFATGAPSGTYLVQVQDYATNHEDPKPFVLALQKPGESVRTIHNLSTTGNVHREVIDVDTFTI